MKKLKDLPREYFHEIDNKQTKETSPKIALVLLCFSLFLCVMSVVFSNSFGEATFSLYFSLVFVIIEVLLILIMLILTINNLWQRIKKTHSVLELLSFTICTYSSIPVVISFFTIENLPVYITLSPLLLFPLGFAFQYFLVNNYRKAIFAGKFLPGGEGALSKSTLKKYAPIVGVVTAFLESSRLTLIIWARLTMRIHGNIVGIFIFPFSAILLVLSLSVLVALKFLNVYFQIGFLDWGAAKQKGNPKFGAT